MSYLFAFSYCSWGSCGKNTGVGCHFLLYWAMFCQNSLLWPVCLWWPCTAWLIVSLIYASPFATTRLWSMKESTWTWLRVFFGGGRFCSNKFTTFGSSSYYSYYCIPEALGRCGGAVGTDSFSANQLHFSTNPNRLFWANFNSWTPASIYLSA